ncbi:acylphosphatase [uncultured Bifidobacterium sp.]|uniref:acylphosphatase n=1 Tax=uncultured Bifidobacterium sp. TaxID=165187 RepID=UPI0028DBC589|nr:acylphosphatase [uncultured Bifidobacterium sp.]
MPTGHGHRASQDGKGSVLRMRFLVDGLVQGVGYRYFVVTASRRLALTGWVRNRRDGSVEVEAQGSSDALAELRVLLTQGPRWGHVDSVAAQPIPAVKDSPVKGSRGFRVLPDV